MDTLNEPTHAEGEVWYQFDGFKMREYTIVNVIHKDYNKRIVYEYELTFDESRDRYENKYEYEDEEYDEISSEYGTTPDEAKIKYFKRNLTYYTDDLNKTYAALSEITRGIEDLKKNVDYDELLSKYPEEFV